MELGKKNLISLYSTLESPSHLSFSLQSHQLSDSLALICMGRKADPSMAGLCHLKAPNQTEHMWWHQSSSPQEFSSRNKPNASEDVSVVVAVAAE